MLGRDTVALLEFFGESAAQNFLVGSLECPFGRGFASAWAIMQGQLISWAQPNSPGVQNEGPQVPFQRAFCLWKGHFWIERLTPFEGDYSRSNNLGSTYICLGQRTC